MNDFLTPRRLAPVSRIEKVGVAAGAAALLGAWPTSSISWLSGTLTAVGIAIIAAVIGSLVKDWRWRKLFSGSEVDPWTVVYTSRSGYPNLLRNVVSAKSVDLMGISLAYALEYVRDNADDFFKRVDQFRILLPGSMQVCDERDRAQSSAVGTLTRTAHDAIATVTALQRDYPRAVSVRYFTLQPYAAMTRIDDLLWISPYLTKSGSNSPVISVDKRKSGKLFSVYLEHFESVWDRSTETPLDLLRNP